VVSNLAILLAALKQVKRWTFFVWRNNESIHKTISVSEYDFAGVNRLLFNAFGCPG
jgi:hypothetical protein